MEYEKQERKWDKKYTKIKLSTTYEQLCKGMPPQFLEYFKYCDKLKFEQRPDYEHLYNLLDALLKE